LLSFIFHNRDFSKGCGRFKQKNSGRISGCARLVEAHFGGVSFLRVGSLSTAEFDPVTVNGIAQISIFAKIVRLVCR
jgi:hypothetical protein